MTVAALPDDPPISTLDLWPAPEACGAARGFAEEVLTAWGLSEAAVYNGKLIVNELVTNAVQASPADQRITVRMFLDENGLPVVEVQDQVDAEPRIRTPAKGAENGRGLLLVQAHGERWGTTPVNGGGKVVWAVCPRLVALDGWGQS